MNSVPPFYDNPKISNESKNEISEIVKQPNIQPHPECVQP